MTIANNPDKYRQAWREHVDQMVHLAFSSGITYEEWTQAKQRMYQWIEDAILNDFDRSRGNE